MVSVILPAYNAAHFIEEAVNSVLQQTYKNWELFIIDDGSTDETGAIVKKYLDDTRIKYYRQENRGVSAARNLGLENAIGDFICFLDADDKIPPISLEARLKMFSADPDLHFVDGTVILYDSELEKQTGRRILSYKGKALPALLRLDPNCFFGPSWMVKSEVIGATRFKSGLTHAEDLLFFIELARKEGVYASTSEEVLHYRATPNSAMKNLSGLAEGYNQLFIEVKRMPEVSSFQLFYLFLKIKKIVVLSWFAAGEYLKAFRAFTQTP